MSSDWEIESLPEDDLLEGVSDTQPRPQSIVDKWLKSAGIYPGTSKVPSATLYNEFYRWCQANSEIIEKIPTNTQWGKEMGRRIKRGRSESGRFYYISRREVPEIPEELSQSDS